MKAYEVHQVHEVHQDNEVHHANKVHHANEESINQITSMLAICEKVAISVLEQTFNQVVSIFRTEKPEMLGTGLEIITSLLTSRFPRTDNMDWIFLHGRNGMIKWCIVVNTS